MKKLFFIFFCFISLFSNAQTCAWAKNATGVSNGVSIRVDLIGNSFVTGNFSDSLTFENYTLYNGGIFLVKYDTKGNVIWAKRIANGGSVSCISLDATANCYIMGSFNEFNITLGTITLTNTNNIPPPNSNYADVFIAKIDSSGNVLWAKNAKGNYRDNGTGISTDVNGNSYITGYFYSPTLTFDSTVIMNSSSGNGNNDIFIAKFDSSGKIIWGKSDGGCGRGNSIKVDTKGNLFVTGHFYKNNVFGSTSLPNVNPFGIADVFIVKYDTSGKFAWAKSAGGTSHDYGTSISVDQNGNSYLTGYFQSPSISFDSIFTLTNFDSTGNTVDFFVAKYDSTGKIIWTKSAGGASADYAYAVSTDANGNSYITGQFHSTTINFGNDTLTNNGAHDIFIVKYDIAGNVLWAKNFGGALDDDGSSICSDVNQTCYLTGNFSSPSINFCNDTLVNSNSGNNNFLVAKFDTLLFPTNIISRNHFPQIIISPNPFSTETTISIQSSEYKNLKLVLYDVFGRVVKTLNIEQSTAKLEREKLPGGIYFYKVSSEEKIIGTGKIIAE